jgi:uncharacterized membrane protein YesL
MRSIFPVLWEALKHFWEDFFVLTVMNILTVLLVLPVVTFPPALAGLWYIGSQAANGRAVQWSDYFWGFRRYFLKAWGLALINILVAAIVLTNIWFYGPDVVPFNISETLTVWIRSIFVGLGFVWWCYQLYPMAMLLEQEDQRIRLALRNSAILLIANPGATFVLGVLSLLVIALSLRFPPLMVLLALSLLAVVCNQVVIHLLKPFREKAKAEATQEDQEASGEPGEEKTG